MSGEPFQPSPRAARRRGEGMDDAAGCEQTPAPRTSPPHLLVISREGLHRSACSAATPLATAPPSTAPIMRSMHSQSHGKTNASREHIEGRKPSQDPGPQVLSRSSVDVRRPLRRLRRGRAGLAGGGHFFRRPCFVLRTDEGGRGCPLRRPCFVLRQAAGGLEVPLAAALQLEAAARSPVEKAPPLLGEGPVGSGGRWPSPGVPLRPCAPKLGAGRRAHRGAQGEDRD